MDLYRAALENPPLLVACDMDRLVVHTNFTATRQEVHEIPLDALGEPRATEAARGAAEIAVALLDWSATGPFQSQ